MKKDHRRWINCTEWCVSPPCQGKSELGKIIRTDLESISGVAVAFKLERLLLDVDDRRRGWLVTPTLPLHMRLFCCGCCGCCCCCCCFWCCLKRERLKKRPRIAFKFPSLMSANQEIAMRWIYAMYCNTLNNIRKWYGLIVIIISVIYLFMYFMHFMLLI